jgi:hypothetical protein
MLRVPCELHRVTAALTAFVGVLRTNLSFVILSLNVV